MKALAKINWVSIVMVCVSFSFVACGEKGEYGDDDWLMPTPAKNDTIVVRDTVTVHKTDTVTTDPSTPTPTDSVRIDWSAQMEKSFGFVKQTGLWPSTITIHLTNGKTEDFGCYLPMETQVVAPEEVMAASDAPASRYAGMEPAVKDSTNWEQNPSDGYFYRTVTRRQVIHMTNYDATIVSSHKEAYMVKEGRVIYFLHGEESTPTRYDDTPTTGEDVQRNGKTYSVENAIITMQHHLHGLVTERPSATTRVLREKVEEQEEQEPVTPTPDPTMPTPDLKVSSFGLVNNITFSPEFQGNNVTWHKVCLTRNYINGKEYFSIWVDGKFVRTVELNSKEANNKYNSAYYAEGAWRVAILKYSTAGDGGWDYSFVVDGQAKYKSIDQNMALTSGLSNFKKDNNASQTPSVYTTTSVKEYNGKKLVTVSGYDKDMRPVINFTIGECL